LKWSDADYANVSCVCIQLYSDVRFEWTIIDKIGTKKGFAIFCRGWSTVSMLHALRIYYAILYCTFFLRNYRIWKFPGGVKASTEWIPLKERALAIGIFNAGNSHWCSYCGSYRFVLAVYFGWRWLFIATGLLGFIWLFFWLKYYHFRKIIQNN
jgi:ACS family hexuronate transporter-like MFS transporter